MKIIGILIGTGLAMAHGTSVAMSSGNLCRLHIPEQPESINTQLSVARSIALCINSHTSLPKPTEIKTFDQAYTEMVAQFYLLKGLGQALSRAEQSNEHTSLMASAYQEFIHCSSLETSAHEKKPVLDEKIKKMLSKLHKHIDPNDIRTAIILYQGAFKHLQKNNPLTYAAALRWALSEIHDDGHVGSLFDMKSYDDGKELLTGCSKRKHFCSCIIV